MGRKPKKPTRVDSTGEVISGPEPGEETLPALDGSPAGDMVIKTEGVGATSVATRESEKIRAALIFAMHRPRDEVKARAAIMKACSQMKLAEIAEYSFPRGKGTVSGASIYLSRAITRCWGNIRKGMEILSVTENNCHIKGWALDCETNTYEECEAWFKPLIQRKRGDKTIWVKADQRDLRELINKHAAMLVRNATLALIPKDVTDEAIETARATLQKGIAEDDPVKSIARMVMFFERVGVTPEMLDARLGHSVNHSTVEERAELFGIYNSLKDGNSKRDDYFDIPGAPEGREPATAAVDPSKVKSESEEKPPGSRDPEEAGPPEGGDELFGN